MNYAITGWPKSGKTTVLAPALGVPIRSTDDLLPKYSGKDRWSGISEESSYWFDDDGPWCIEGTPVARALRKWLLRNPEGKPCDVLYVLTVPRVPLTGGQRSMGVGVETVLREIAPELKRRGVRVVTLGEFSVGEVIP